MATQSSGARAETLGPNSLLSKVLGRSDPLMQFEWSGFIQVGDLRLEPHFIENVDIPGVQTASDPVYRAGTKVYVATTYDVGAVRLKLYEDIQMSTIKFLQQWFRLIHRDNGSHGIPKDYKGFLEVTPLKPNGDIIARIKCIGVFPTQHPTLPFGHESDRIALDVEFSCDFVEFEFPR